MLSHKRKSYFFSPSYSGKACWQKWNFNGYLKDENCIELGKEYMMQVPSQIPGNSNPFKSIGERL